MRYVESNMASLRKEDFVARTRVPTVMQFIIIFLTGYLCICGAFVVSKGSFGTFSVIATVTLALMNGLMVLSVQRSRDQMLATEYQNALYAAALSQCGDFCLIMRKDGKVVHADSGFRTLYPQFDSQSHKTLDDVFHMAGVAKADADKIYAAFGSGMPRRQSLSLCDGDGCVRRVLLDIDTIRRPQDHMVLRGHAAQDNAPVAARQ